MSMMIYLLQVETECLPASKNYDWMSASIIQKYDSQDEFFVNLYLKTDSPEELKKRLATRKMLICAKKDNVSWAPNSGLMMISKKLSYLVACFLLFGHSFVFAGEWNKISMQRLLIVKITT